MHQDQPFYAHEDLRYACALIHLDDTYHENGEIRFLDGSHKRGYIKHITSADDGVSTPHLPTDRFKHADTSAVPGRRGDVVMFNLCTVHGSYIKCVSVACASAPRSSASVYGKPCSRAPLCCCAALPRCSHTQNQRRMVRVCYRNPENKQISGQSMGRPGVIVHGKRPREGGLAAPSQAPLEASPDALNSSAELDEWKAKL